MKAIRENLITILILTLSTLGTFPSLSEGNNIGNIISSLQKKYRNVHSLEADFTQKNFIASLNRVREFRGKIFLQKPRLFDIEVSFPSVQRQVFDGRFLWVYTSANNQVLKNSVAPDFFDHPLINLLTTMENLEKNYSITLEKPKNSVDYSIKLTLKTPTTELREILIAVQKKDFQIKELTFRYDSGNYTHLALIDIKENKKIPPERFQFILSPGAEVVESPGCLTRP